MVDNIIVSTLLGLVVCLVIWANGILDRAKMYLEHEREIMEQRHAYDRALMSMWLDELLAGINKLETVEREREP